jgi:hypothetical protein
MMSFPSPVVLLKNRPDVLLNLRPRHRTASADATIHWVIDEAILIV